MGCGCSKSRGSDRPLVETYPSCNAGAVAFLIAFVFLLLILAGIAFSKLIEDKLKSDHPLQDVTTHEAVLEKPDDR